MTAPIPAAAPAVTWGFIGSGWIAEQFAAAINTQTASTVAAVGSRSLERAEAFAAEHLVAKAYGSYGELVADADVDVVYVATPHSHHREHALLAIAAGKHVLVEKAFTRNAAEARDVIEAAEAAGVFVMEAMWTRFLPHIVDIKETIARGDIGEVVSVQADHGQLLTHVDRLMTPELAGGALLDLGVYPVSFVHDLLGVPESVTAVGQLTDSGVDGQVSMVLGYENAHATLHTTMWANTPNTAVISGTSGRIEIGPYFYSPTSFRVVRGDGTTWSVESDVPHGYAYEAAEVATRIAAGETASPSMTPQDTLDVMTTLDEVRRQIGLSYPGE